MAYTTHPSNALLAIFLITILGMITITTEALQCYECSGVGDNCDTLKDTTKVGTCDGKKCISVVLDENNKNPPKERFRFCTNVIELDYSCLSETCICDTSDKCNDKTPPTPVVIEQPTEPVECYQCSGEGCKKPVDTMKKCRGFTCISMTLEQDGKKEEVRACSYIYTTVAESCKEDFMLKIVKRRICRCVGALCNKDFITDESKLPSKIKKITTVKPTVSPKTTVNPNSNDNKNTNSSGNLKIYSGVFNLIFGIVAALLV